MKESSARYVNKLHDESTKAAKKLEQFQEVLNLFPDVEVHCDRWENIRFGTTAVNYLVDKVEIRHGCGCCSDSPLFVYPYTTLPNGGEVCSEPHQFCVGEQNAYGYGEREHPGWEEEMRKAGINAVAIKQVREYLDTHKPEECEDED